MSKTVEQVMADEMRCGIEELGDERCIMPGWLAKASIIRLGDRDVVLDVDREELARIVEGVIVGDYRKNARTKADESVDTILAKLAEQGLREVGELVRGARGILDEDGAASRFYVAQDSEEETTRDVAVLKPLPQAKEVEDEA